MLVAYEKVVSCKSALKVCLRNVWSSDKVAAYSIANNYSHVSKLTAGSYRQDNKS